MKDTYKTIKVLNDEGEEIEVDVPIKKVRGNPIDKIRKIIQKSGVKLKPYG